MSNKGGKAGGEGSGAPSSADGARGTNIAVIAAGVILIGLVAVAVYRMNRTNHPSGNGIVSVDGSGAPVTGSTVSAPLPVDLSPQAQVASERYRCVCGCNDPLSECTCTQTPGSYDMKEHLQSLVDAGMSLEELDQGMVERYGDQALLSNPFQETAGPGNTP